MRHRAPRFSGLGVATSPAQATINAIASLFGSSTAPNPNALAIVQKWYAWYFPDWAAMNAGTAVTLQSGYTWWVNQINTGGVANAWTNFSTSAQPVQDSVAQRAALYQQLGYGAPTAAPPAGTNPLVAPPTNLTYQQFTGASAPAATSIAQPTPVQVLSSAGATPQQIAALTPAQQAAAAAQIAPAQASILGGMSSTTLLLVGGGLLVGLVLMNRNRSAAAS